MIKRLKNTACAIGRHMKSLGFTNRLGIYILLFLAAGMIGGFYLAVRSIQYNYSGSLMCWTIVFTPIGTAVSMVLGKIVQKSAMENTGADGEGIKYAMAKASGFCEDYSDISENSPPI